MTTRPHSTIFLSAGLMVLVATAGCKINRGKCSVCNDSIDTWYTVPHDVVWQDMSGLPGGPGCQPNYQYEQYLQQATPQPGPHADPRQQAPMAPALPSGVPEAGSYSPTPIPGPIPAPAPGPVPTAANMTRQSQRPRHVLVAPEERPNVLHRGQSNRVSGMSTDNYRPATSSDYPFGPVAEPPETQRRLVPRPLATPKLIKPASRKFRSMLDNVRTRFGREKLSDLNGSARPATPVARRAAPITRPAVPVTRVAASAAPVPALVKHSRPPANIRRTARSHVSSKTTTTVVLANRPHSSPLVRQVAALDSWHTRLPQSVSPAAMTSELLTVTQQSLPLWPHAPGYPRPRYGN